MRVRAFLHLDRFRDVFSRDSFRKKKRGRASQVMAFSSRIRLDARTVLSCILSLSLSLSLLDLFRATRQKEARRIFFSQSRRAYTRICRLRGSFFCARSQRLKKSTRKATPVGHFLFPSYLRGGYPFVKTASV